MLLETLRCRKQLIEIPVNFQVARKGVKERDQNPATFFAIAALILKRRLKKATDFKSGHALTG